MKTSAQQRRTNPAPLSMTQLMRTSVRRIMSGIPSNLINDTLFH